MGAKEGKVQKKIIEYLTNVGAEVVKVERANKRGVSDLLVCYRGRFLAIEVKEPGKPDNTTELQDIFLGRVKKAQGYSIVATSTEEVLILLKKVDYDMHSM